MKFVGEKVPGNHTNKNAGGAAAYAKRRATRGRRRQEKLFCKGFTTTIYPRHIRGWAD